MKYVLFFTFLVFAFPVYAEAQDCSLSGKAQVETDKVPDVDPCDLYEEMDAKEKWDKLKKEKQELLEDPDNLIKHCTECKARCEQDWEQDPLRKWICIQCNDDCSSLNTENEE